MMRRAGMNETLIACVIQDVRSATLNEEFRRIVNLVTYSPPHHHSFSDTSRGIAEWCKEEDPL